jgi:hypothetical protein
MSKLDDLHAKILSGGAAQPQERVHAVVTKGDFLAKRGEHALWRAIETYESDSPFVRAVIVSNSKFHRAGHEVELLHKDDYRIVDPHAYTKEYGLDVELLVKPSYFAPRTIMYGKYILTEAKRIAREEWKKGRSFKPYFKRAAKSLGYSVGASNEFLKKALVWAEDAVENAARHERLYGPLRTVEDVVRIFKLAAEQRVTGS